MSTYTAFQPVAFGNFAKANKDLFKKKFDFDSSLKVFDRSIKNGTIESGVVLAKGTTEPRGYVKTTIGLPSYGGVFEGEAHTDARQESKGTFRFSKLAKGLSVAVTGSSKDKDKSFKAGVASVELEYKRDYLAVKEVMKTDGSVHKMESHASTGYGNVSVGASVAADLTSGANVTDINVGAEYNGGDWIGSVWTENNRQALNAGYYFRRSRDQSIGGQLKFDLGKNTRSFLLGTEQRVGANSVVKAKVELNPAAPANPIVGASLEHRLVNPNALVALAAQTKVNGFQVQNADSFGINISLGDF